MEGFLDTLANMETRLEQIQASRLMGICFLDENGQLVQLFEQDPLLKEFIIEYHQDRLRQMRLSERSLAHVSYPLLAD